MHNLYENYYHVVGRTYRYDLRWLTPYPGQILTRRGEIIPTQCGFHACAQAKDALDYMAMRSLWICGVDLGEGPIETAYDLHVSNYRKIEWMIPLDEFLHHLDVILYNDDIVGPGFIDGVQTAMAAWEALKSAMQNYVEQELDVPSFTRTGRKIIEDYVQKALAKCEKIYE